MDEQMNKKVEELIKREDFIEKLSQISTKDEVKKLFAEENVSLSEKELDFLHSTILKKELPDEALENVAGGIGILTMFGIASTVISLAGTVIGFFKKGKK
ncbi:MAG: hypothetical protein NC041_04675 [Bacteroides sp.]|nr:hypothetical protein [Prevotella sp.]MCM1407254.1 hypothetical protein [Treponema brennaborense]MCM1469742.1 hypothetical protein [Bacteroides sp.]